MALLTQGPGPSSAAESDRQLPASGAERDHLLSLAFNSARDMMLLARVEPGPVFRVLAVNAKYLEGARNAGYEVTEADFVGRTFEEVRMVFRFSPELWAPILARYVEAVKTRRPERYEEFTPTPRGLFYGDTTITPVCDSAGACIMVLYTSSDVTDRRRAELALQESEEKFSKAFRAAPGAMAISEPGGRGFIEVNDGYVRMFGYTRAELLGHQLSEFGIWDEEEQRKFAGAFRAQGSVRDLEVVRRRRDGAMLTCLLSADALELGGRKCIVTALYDITERRRAEQALRDSEEKFSKAFRATPNAVFITELDTGRVVDVNTGCHRIYGYAHDECVGRTTLELGIWAQPEDRERVMVKLKENAGTFSGLEVTGRNRWGRIVEVLVSCEIIELDGRSHLVTIAQDITARKQAERALRESEARFAKAFRANPGAMAITDMETMTFVDVNDGYCRIFGYTREEMMGRSGLELGLWHDQGDRTQFFEALTRHESVREMEVTARRRNEEKFACLLSAEKIDIGGRPHFVTAIYDMSERKRAEEARGALEAQLRQAQKLDALGQLAGGIAHDFNNILTGIIAYTELALLDAERPAALRQHLATVRKASDRATDLVRQILTFSRKQAHERRPIAVPFVVKEALKLLRSSLPKTIEFVERIDPATPLVLADPTQLHQVVMNLGTNSAHAMREKPGRLTVTLAPVNIGAAPNDAPPGLAAGRYARLTVTDTGHGMDEATMARVFDPFFTTKAPGEGTGLGLAVVHGIVEDHEGLITVRSRPGEGTTFDLYLPEVLALPAMEPDRGEALPRGDGQRILLIDDEAIVGSAGGEILKRLGYRVTVHFDPRLAWRLFDAAPEAVDLVITDLTMPHLDGAEIVRRMRVRRPATPILVTTGHSAGWSTDSIRALGARALLLKPLSSEKLARAVREILATPNP